MYQNLLNEAKALIREDAYMARYGRVYKPNRLVLQIITKYAGSFTEENSQSRLWGFTKPLLGCWKPFTLGLSRATCLGAL